MTNDKQSVQFAQRIRSSNLLLVGHVTDSDDSAPLQAMTDNETVRVGTSVWTLQNRYRKQIWRGNGGYRIR
jgi:hypothetical protein